MENSIPVNLVIAWIFFTGFYATHVKHAQYFRGASEKYLSALYISIIASKLVAVGLLFYYFFQVSWYWPLLLFLIGNVLGGALFGSLIGIFGILWLSLISFLGWPLAATWAFFIIRKLGE